jgi:S1-C subfamily serine protease
MTSVWKLFLIVAAVVPLHGCVIAVGNDLGEDQVQWEDDDERPRIGVVLGSVNSALASQLGVDDEQTTLILSVMDGLPADRAGVKKHDVIIQIDGSDDASPQELRRAIRSARPGAELKLRAIRAGQPVELTVVMDGDADGGPEE